MRATILCGDAMKPDDGDGWVDEAVGACVTGAGETRALAAAACNTFPRLARLVELLAQEVTTGADAAQAVHAVADRTAVAAAGAWHEWGRVKARLRQHRRLISGGGVSACAIALCVFLWPHPPATAAPGGDYPPARMTAEELLAAGRCDEAERAAVGLPDVRRYHLLGEVARARGDEVTAGWCYGKAAALGNRQAGLCLIRTPNTAQPSPAR